MKSLNQHINEAFKLSSSSQQYLYHPKDVFELREIIEYKYRQNKDYLDCTDIEISPKIDSFYAWKSTINNTGIFANLECKVIDITGWDTSHVKIFAGMFEGCSQLEKIIGIDDLDTSSLTNINRTFLSCWKLRDIDISRWKYRNINPKRTDHTFQNCEVSIIPNWYYKITEDA